MSSTLWPGFMRSLAAMWRFLASLRLFERHVGPLEIGAGILHVLVEEEPVELAGEIVVALRRCVWSDAPC